MKVFEAWLILKNDSFGIQASPKTETVAPTFPKKWLGPLRERTRPCGTLIYVVLTRAFSELIVVKLLLLRKHITTLGEHHKNKCFSHHLERGGSHRRFHSKPVVCPRDNYRGFVQQR